MSKEEAKQKAGEYKKQVITLKERVKEINNHLERIGHHYECHGLEKFREDTEPLRAERKQLQRDLTVAELHLQTYKLLSRVF